jgi:type VI secretion system protein ImpB
MLENTQQKLARVRPPRVHITYDVEVGDAVEKKELPLVVGILADLVGQPESPLPKLKERRFVEIDSENFNHVLASFAPRLKFLVENKLKNDGSSLPVELRFKSLDDFSPAAVVKQVEPLRKLLEIRQRLVDLRAKLDGNEDLNALLQEVIRSPKGVTDLKKEVERAKLAPPPQNR